MNHGCSSRQCLFGILQALTFLIALVSFGPITATVAQAQPFTTLYSFCTHVTCTSGRFPTSSLIQATGGDFYGAASIGGTHDSAICSAVTPGGKLTTLYTFCSQAGCTDGAYPAAPLIQARNGTLYGTTLDGGANLSSGTVFEITPSGALTTLYSFCSANENCTDGTGPNGLIQATNGGLYGTTVGGGIHNGGTIFSLDVSDGRSSR